jgi:diguanylate cyclase (GGDEF)-like protein
LSRQVNKSSWTTWARFIGVAAVLLSPLAAHSQRYVIREYTHGLGNLNITSIAQDKTGYLWVGTQNGAYRYDGDQFKRFGTDAGLPERTINSLYIGLDGTLWVATSTGVYFKRSDETFSMIKPPAPLNEIDQQGGSVFSSVSPNEVIAATHTGLLKLTRSENEVWTAQVEPDEGKQVWGVLYGRDGSIWYGCDESLCRARNGKTAHLGSDHGLPDDNWISLRETSDGHIWLRGNRHIGELDPATDNYTAHDVPDSTFVEPYPRLAIDSRGHILTAQGSDLCVWEKDHWRVLSRQNGLSHFEIQDIFVGRQGSVWMGVVGHGLLRWMAQDRWESYTTGNGLRDNLVWAETRDQQGRLWIATESGLNWLPPDGGEMQEWNLPGVPHLRSGSVAVGPDGTIWAGGAERLVRINPKTLHGESWKVPSVFTLTVDHLGRVWVATSAGLWLYDSSVSSSPQRVDDPAFVRPKGQFDSFATDGSGRLWVASEEGVFRRDVDGWHRLNMGTSGARPDLIAFDGAGYLWASGASQDLMRLRLNGDRVVESTSIKTPQILSQQVVALMADHRGWIWVGQDAGLSVFDGTQWRSYTQEDGLVWNDIDSYALMEDTDGSIWVGTSGGLSHLLDPRVIATRSEVAPVFSEVTYGGAELANGASIKWSNTTLDVSMAVLSFRGGHEESVRYRMLGEVSTGWDEARDFSVRYGHLSPGSYKFEAVTVDGAGRQLSQPAVFQFRILPRWWQRTSLQVSLAILVFVLLILIWRWRMRSYRSQKRELERAVRTRTQELEKEKGELVRMREQMRHFAEHDGLSGLWNHRIIVERLKGEVERSRRDGAPISVILADVDFFKKINDTYGHPFGDHVLKEVSSILQRMVRSYDWVGRYGGEEFMLVLPGASLEHARDRANEMRRAVENAVIEENGKRVPVTISLGVASGFPKNYEMMVQAADGALYEAKNGGRNKVVAAEVLEIRALAGRG